MRYGNRRDEDKPRLKAPREPRKDIKICPECDGVGEDAEGSKGSLCPSCWGLGVVNTDL